MTYPLLNARLGAKSMVEMPFRGLYVSPANREAVFSALVCSLRRYPFGAAASQREAMAHFEATATYISLPRNRRATFRAAVKLLTEEGLVEQVQGKGDFFRLFGGEALLDDASPPEEPTAREALPEPPGLADKRILSALERLTRLDAGPVEVGGELYATGAKLASALGTYKTHKAFDAAITRLVLSGLVQARVSGDGLFCYRAA